MGLFVLLALLLRHIQDGAEFPDIFSKDCTIEYLQTTALARLTSHQAGNPDFVPGFEWL